MADPKIVKEILAELVGADKMTEWEKLREKIAESASINMLGRNYHELKADEVGYLDFCTDQILSLIKSSFPELANEMGYVRLAKDQSLPDNPIFNTSTNVEFGAFVCKAGFRKVELERRHE